MGCNCGDNEYNIEIENNGSCEPTTPIYNISLGGVGVDGYSPTVEFVDKDAASFKIRVNDVNGTTITEAIPLFTYLIDNYVNNSMLASTLTAYSTTEEINTILEDYVTNSSLSTTLEDYVTQDYLNSNFYDATSVDALLQNVTNNYLKNDGSNASLPFNIGNIRVLTSGNVLRVPQMDVTSYLSAEEIRPRNTSGLIIGYTQQGNYPIKIITNDKAYYNNKEIATVDQIPTKTSDLTNDSGFLIEGDLADYAKITDIPTVGNGTISITQGGVTKGTFTTNQSGNTTIELDEGGGTTYTAGNGINITNDTISIDTSVVATQTDMNNKLATTGQNAASNFAVNGSAFTSDTTYSMITMSKGGVIANVSDGSNYLFLVDNYSAPHGQIGIGILNGYNAGVVIVGDTTIEGQHINVNTSNNGSFQYNNNEVATINQIPTVNNPTITFTQGGVTKGTITLNQSSNQTITLDAGGGGSVTNPIELTGTEVLQDPIPAEYKRLLDIIFDGDTYYIYNGELYGTDDITLTMTPSVTSGQNVCGCYTNNSATDNFSLYISANTNGSYFRYGSTLYRPVFGSPQQRTITIGAPRTYGFSTNIVDIAEQEFTTSTDFYIGALPNSTSAKFKGTFSGNIQISDRVVFIPVERISDGAIGYYVTSTNSFLENQGNGTPTTSGYDTETYTSTKETTLTLGVETTTEETYLAPILKVDQSYTANGITTTNTFNIATEPWVISQGYTSNVGTVTSVNNVQPDANGNVTISAGGASIDDNTPSTTTVYSSQKTQDLIDALVARIAALEANINGGNA